jgi:DNA-binding response OmpR family regulator
MKEYKILIVDDEPYVVKALEFVLRKAGFTTLSAMDGVEALSVVEEHRPHVIFLDIMMPRKDGYEVCRELKQHPDYKDIYVIILSAKGQEIDKRMGLEAGANEYIVKPFSPVKIVEMVKEILKV